MVKTAYEKSGMSENSGNLATNRFRNDGKCVRGIANVLCTLPMRN